MGIIREDCFRPQPETGKDARVRRRKDSESVELQEERLLSVFFALSVPIAARSVLPVLPVLPAFETSGTFVMVREDPTVRHLFACSSPSHQRCQRFAFVQAKQKQTADIVHHSVH